MKKALLVAVCIIIVMGAYFALRPSGAVAPSLAPMATTTSAVQTRAASTIQKPPADTGAGGVYDPNAPAGSAAQCAACGQYEGYQKAQCLAALHCQ